MQILRLLCTWFVVAGLAQPVLAEEGVTDHSKTEHKTMETQPAGETMDHSKLEGAGKKEASGTGVINAVDVDAKSINITHDPMPEFGWPKMTMDLPTTKKVDLSRVKAGDKVTFTLKLGMDKKFRVIDVKPAQ